MSKREKARERKKWKAHFAEKDTDYLLRAMPGALQHETDIVKGGRWRQVWRVRWHGETVGHGRNAREAIIEAILWNYNIGIWT